MADFKQNYFQRRTKDQGPRSNNRISSPEVQVINNDGANLVGTTIFNFNDVNNFYTSFQILKKNRKKMKQMQLDYVYNFNTKSITFENPRVDGKQNQKLDEFLNIFNSEQDRIFNKITFKNFMNNFFNAYAG